MVFSKNGMTGTLQITQIEKGRNYRWSNCLALLDSDGHWLTTMHWRSNAIKKAAEDLKSMGWIQNNP